MANKINELELPGQKFGLLTIQEAWRNSKRYIIVRCVCECGRTYQGLYGPIRQRYRKSCGCAAKLQRGETWRKFRLTPSTKDKPHHSYVQ